MPGEGRTRRLDREARNVAKAAWHRAFRALERVGVHVTPVHFYSGLPRVGELARRPEWWKARSGLPGLSIDLEAQLDALGSACVPFQGEYRGLDLYREAVKRNGEEGYGPIESQALHGFVRCCRPRRVVQIGCGVATHCAMRALDLNAQAYELTCIEPYPNNGLKQVSGIRLIAEPAQQVPLPVFEELGAGDFLLIDSTHTVQVGSEVNYLVLEVLPRLAEGVIVSFHDIYLPYDYARNFLRSLVFPLETTLLRAFLINNAAFEVIASLSLLHYERREGLAAIFPDYVPQADDEGLRQGHEGLHFPSSLWLRVSSGKVGTCSTE